MKASFHKKFVLERDNISKILNFVSENPSASRHQIAEETGIGIGQRTSDGKVRPTIQYAVYSGLLVEESANSRSDILLSEVGKIILANDPRLKSSVTQWTMHYFLSRTDNEALVWSFFAHDFLPRHDEFEIETLRNELARKFTTMSEENVKEYRKILISCYTEANALSKVKLIESYEKDKFIRGSINYPNPYLAAYILAEIWEAKHEDKPAVNPNVLLESGDLVTTLNLNEGDLQNCLNEMSGIGAINQMREAPPYQVVRKWTDKFDLLRRAFEVEQ